jgi:hypothetical protein
MQAGSIIVNREYQRSSTVWPPNARSYLIDTILSGFPMPKVSLYQKTDLQSRKTIKEIVDGQQRSQAILDFFKDSLRITGPSQFSGKRFSDLDEPDQQRFVEYQIDADLFISATDDEIRQMFRRINSYTVPLNPEEQRHATHQGKFKWFIVETTQKYAGTLKYIGVFSERHLSRMNDAKLLTEICLALENGIETYAKNKLDKIYKKNEKVFANEKWLSKNIDIAFEKILELESLHTGPLMRPANFYSLMLAIIHMYEHVSVFDLVFPNLIGRGTLEVVETNLSLLATALEQDNPPVHLTEFVEACAEATNTKNNREKRFRWLCRAQGPELLG